jgi:hypothetical protein
MVSGVIVFFSLNRPPMTCFSHSVWWCTDPVFLRDFFGRECNTLLRLLL